MKRRGNKKSKALLIVLLCLVGLTAVILIGARGYFRLSVLKYYMASEKAFKLPDINNGFIPQGIAYCDADSEFYVTGYMNDKSASPIYRIDKSGTTVGCVSLRDDENNEYTGHAGGIEVHGDYVYVAGGEDACLYVYDKNEIRNAAYGTSVGAIGIFDLKVSDNDYMPVACMTHDDNSLYVAEFYRDPNYPTLEGHKLVTGAGDYNQAVALKFDFSEGNDSQFGISKTPTSVYSLPDLVQGLCVKDGKMYLSTSYAVAFSHIYSYDLVKAYTGSQMHVLDSILPLYELDSASMLTDKKIAPMSEEIVIVDGKMYTMCESASNKYIFGKLTSSNWCYATDMTFFE